MCHTDLLIGQSQLRFPFPKWLYLCQVDLKPASTGGKRARQLILGRNRVMLRSELFSPLGRSQTLHTPDSLAIDYQFTWASGDYRHCETVFQNTSTERCWVAGLWKNNSRTVKLGNSCIWYQSFCCYCFLLFSFFFFLRVTKNLNRIKVIKCNGKGLSLALLNISQAYLTLGLHFPFSSY